MKIQKRSLMLCERFTISVLFIHKFLILLLCHLNVFRLYDATWQLNFLSPKICVANLLFSPDVSSLKNTNQYVLEIVSSLFPDKPDILKALVDQQIPDQIQITASTSSSSFSPNSSSNNKTPNHPNGSSNVSPREGNFREYTLDSRINGATGLIFFFKCDFLFKSYFYYFCQ